MGALTRKAFADVLRRPARTLLVILGITIGVFGLTAINVANDTVYSALTYSQSVANVANGTFFTDKVPASILPLITAIPHVQQAQIASYYATRWQVQAAPGHVNIDVYAFPDEQHIALDAFQVTQGHLPGPGEIVMDFSDGSFQPVHIGDTAIIDSPHGPVALRIAGISRTLGAESAAISSRAVGYMNTGALDQLVGLTQPNLVQVQIQQTDQATMNAAFHAVYTTLRAHGVQVQGYNFTYQPFSAGPLPGIFAVMRVLSLVALLLTALLIINTVTTLVAEQTKIIGTMKALGGTRGAIMRSYLLSVVFYGLVGTALGLALGIWGGQAFAGYIATLIVLDLGPFTLSPGVVITSMVIGLVIPILAALAPLWAGTAVTVHEAMSAYGVSAGGNGQGSRGATGRRGGVGRIRGLSQTMLMGLRSVFRRRGRAALTLVALTLTGTAFMAIATTSASVDRTGAQIFGEHTYDIALGVNRPQPVAKMEALLSALPNVSHVEESATDSVLMNGKVLGIEGLVPDTQIYQPDVIAGTWLTGATPDEMVVSDLVAQNLHKHVGDTLTTTLPTNTQTWTIIGVVHDPDSGSGYLGSTFVTLHDLNAFNQQPQGLSSNFYMLAQDRSSDAVNQLATMLDQRLSALGLAPDITTRQQQIQRSNGQFQILFGILYGVAGIVALVGILGLANTLTTSVLERRREIGILRAMGATGWGVARVFWTEGLALALIAWLIGVILSFPAAYGFVQLIDHQLLALQFAFSPLALAWMLVAILAVATLASFGPALSAARTRIAAILRYE
jgi:putative ABC transport system permease protein